MAALLWIPGVLRAAGLTVHEVPGWQTRGADGWDIDAMRPAGVLCHATAGAANGNESVELGIVTNGREGLAGPIAQTFLQRNGHWTMIAAGVANHAGRGGLWGVSGNQTVIGVEASNNNKGEPWPAAQYDSYVRGVAAMLRRLGLPASRAAAHREWSTSGKTDPVGIDMTVFRARVAAAMAGEGEMELTDDMSKDMGFPTTVGKVLKSTYDYAKTAKTAAVDAKAVATDAAQQGAANAAALAEVKAMITELRLATGDPAAIAAAVREAVADELRDRLAE